MEPGSSAYLLCSSCGYLQPSAPAVAGDPMRRATYDRSACPCCRRSAWVAADTHPLASHDAPLVGELRIWRLVPVFLLALVPAVAVAAPFGNYVGDGGFWVIVYPLLALLVFAAIARLRRGPGSIAHDAVTLPQRWHVPLPSASRRARRFVRTAAVQPSVALVRAPISGVACVAYGIAVRRRHDDDGWLLVEQHSTACRVDGLAIPRDRVLLPLGHRIRPRDDGAARARAWLRDRGIPTALDRLEIFEVLVMPGVVMRLALVRHPWCDGTVDALRRVD